MNSEISMGVQGEVANTKFLRDYAFGPPKDIADFMVLDHTKIERFPGQRPLNHQGNI